MFEKQSHFVRELVRCRDDPQRLELLPPGLVVAAALPVPVAATQALVAQVVHHGARPDHVAVRVAVLARGSTLLQCGTVERGVALAAAAGAHSRRDDEAVQLVELEAGAGRQQPVLARCFVNRDLENERCLLCNLAYLFRYIVTGRTVLLTYLVNLTKVPKFILARNCFISRN
jgi:hypothetical protein